MEQFQKEKKSFNKHDKGKHGERASVTADKTGGANTGALSQSHQHDNERRGRIQTQTRGSSYKYTGTFDLADSFEAEEKKKNTRAQSAARGQDFRATADSDKVDPDKGLDRKNDRRKINKPQSSASRSRPSSKNAKAKSIAPDKSARRGKSGEESRFDADNNIKTKVNSEYIPFESEYDYDESDDFSALYESEGLFTSKKRGSGMNKSRKGTDFDGVPGAVVGRNAVRELLRSDRSVDKLYVKSGSREGSIVVIVAEAVNKKIPIVEVSSEKLDTLAGGPHHQGVVAMAAEKQYTDIEGILNIAKERNEKPLIVIADGIEDPQNLGAMIRCAECAGVHGVIIPKRRAVGLTPIVTKASAGAIEHMAIAKVANLAEAVEKLKKAGLWIFSAEAGGTAYYDADFNVPCAIVFGSEGFGVSRLIKERSDFMVSIPMYGHVNSLNVSTAASVILCHAARMQRT